MSTSNKFKHCKEISPILYSGEDVTDFIQQVINDTRPLPNAWDVLRAWNTKVSCDRNEMGTD